MKDTGKRREALLVARAKEKGVAGQTGLVTRGSTRILLDSCVSGVRLPHTRSSNNDQNFSSYKNSLRDLRAC